MMDKFSIAEVGDDSYFEDPSVQRLYNYVK